MSTLQNSITISSGGSNFATCFLPKELALPPSERESFIEYGDGHQPSVVRIFMTDEQWKAIPDTAWNPSTAGPALTYFSVTMTGNANAYPATAGTQSIAGQTLTTGPWFFILRKEMMRVGLNTSIWRITLVSDQFWWRRVAAYPIGYDLGTHLPGGPSATPIGVFNGSNGTFNQTSRDKFRYVEGVKDSSYTPYDYKEILDAILGTVGVATVASTWPITPICTPNNFHTLCQVVADLIPKLLDPCSCRLTFNPWLMSNQYTVTQTDYTQTSETTILENLSTVVSYEGNTAAFEEDIALIWAPRFVSVIPSGSGFKELQWTPSENDFSDGYSYSGFVVPTGTGGGSGQSTEFINDTTDIVFASDQYEYMCAFSSNVLGDGPLSYSIVDACTERGNFYLLRTNLIPKRWVFTGGYPIPTGPTIRKIRVSMDSGSSIDDGGWFTTVTQHGCHPFSDNRQSGAFRDFIKSATFPQWARTSMDWDSTRATDAETSCEMTNLVNITGTNGCGFGKYIGDVEALEIDKNFVLSDDYVSASSTFVDSTGGFNVEGTTAYVVNLAELNKQTNSLALTGTGNGAIPGRYMGRTTLGATSGAGIPVYAVYAFGTNFASTTFDVDANASGFHLANADQKTVLFQFSSQQSSNRVQITFTGGKATDFLIL